MNVERHLKNTIYGKITRAQEDDKPAGFDYYNDVLRREMLGRELFKLRYFVKTNGVLPDRYVVPKHLGYAEELGYRRAMSNFPKLK